MNLNPVHQLDQSYRSVINLARKIPEEQWYQQFHPDLSPIGWHIGHCVYIESFWLQNKLANNKQNNVDLRNLYLPWLSKKNERAEKLPDSGLLIESLASQHKNNLDLLNDFIEKGFDHELLENNYLPEFLTQHYFQHIETLHQIIQCMVLERSASVPGNLKPLQPVEPVIPEQTVGETRARIGAHDQGFAYDNEKSRHTVELDMFCIAENPVTNAEYLGFMENGGYKNSRYWSNEGKDFLERNNIDRPLHWLKTDNHYFCIEHGKPASLKPDAAVHGISFFEAQAYASYADCRLPHETEWEFAISNGRITNTGQAWEWCGNHFYPYPGFIPYPYDQYSQPWFDDQHYTLRGGSIYTEQTIKRPTFRNFYTPEKRHIFAGARLARTP